MNDTSRIIEITITPRGEITIKTKNLIDKPGDDGMTVQLLPGGSLLIVVRDTPKGAK